MSLRGAWRLAGRAVVAATSVVVLLLMLSFALPIPLWRTGEPVRTPLEYRGELFPLLGSGEWLWIDTDAACGTGRHRDPDDCLALLALFLRHRARIAGVSTVFGNASIDTTDATARAIARAVGSPATAIAIWRGCGQPVPVCGRNDATPPPARDALATMLRRQPLTFLALGPLTNLASVIEREPALAERATRVVAVMGRRPGHVFHPTEGRGAGALLFGHGPVFRDLNAELDPRAVEIVLNAGLELVLLPYAAARDVLLDEADLRFIARQGPAGALVAERSREWLDFWRRAVGLDGFYPFDLLVAAFLEDATGFRCADVIAWVGRDPDLPWSRSVGLLATQGDEGPVAASTVGRAIYCDEVARADLRALFVP